MSHFGSGISCKGTECKRFLCPIIGFNIAIDFTYTSPRPNVINGGYGICYVILVAGLSCREVEPYWQSILCGSVRRYESIYKSRGKGAFHNLLSLTGSVDLEGMGQKLGIEIRSVCVI